MIKSIYFSSLIAATLMAPHAGAYDLDSLYLDYSQVGKELPAYKDIPEAYTKVSDDTSKVVSSNALMAGNGKLEQAIVNYDRMLFGSDTELGLIDQVFRVGVFKGLTYLHLANDIKTTKEARQKHLAQLWQQSRFLKLIIQSSGKTHYYPYHHKLAAMYFAQTEDFPKALEHAHQAVATCSDDIPNKAELMQMEAKHLARVHPERIPEAKEMLHNALAKVEQDRSKISALAYSIWRAGIYRELARISTGREAQRFAELAKQCADEEKDEVLIDRYVK